VEIYSLLSIVISGAITGVLSDRFDLLIMKIYARSWPLIPPTLPTF